MGFSIPSFSNIAKTVGSFVGEAAGKVASAVTQQQAPAQTPAASQKPVDTFEAPAPSKPVVCGGTDTAGAQCLPTWGKASGGGGGPAGVNPSSR